MCHSARPAVSSGKKLNPAPPPTITLHGRGCPSDVVRPPACGMRCALRAFGATNSNAARIAKAKRIRLPSSAVVTIGVHPVSAGKRAGRAKEYQQNGEPLFEAPHLAHNTLRQL